MYPEYKLKLKNMKTLRARGKAYGLRQHCWRGLDALAWSYCFLRSTWLPYVAARAFQPQTECGAIHGKRKTRIPKIGGVIFVLVVTFVLGTAGLGKLCNAQENQNIAQRGREQR